MTQKYVDLKWVDSKMKHDPVYLFENKPEKFQKFLKKRRNIKESDSDQDAPPTTQPVSAPQKKLISAAPAFQKQVSAPVPGPDLGDLISFGSTSN